MMARLRRNVHGQGASTIGRLPSPSDRHGRNERRLPVVLVRWLLRDPKRLLLFVSVTVTLLASLSFRSAVSSRFPLVAPPRISLRRAVRSARIPPPFHPWQYDVDLEAEGGQPFPGLIANLEDKIKSVMLRESEGEPMPDHEPSLYVIRNGILWAPVGQQADWKAPRWFDLYEGRVAAIENNIQSALNVLKEMVEMEREQNAVGELFPERWREALLSPTGEVVVPIFLNALDDIHIGCFLPEPKSPPKSPSLFPMLGWSMNPTLKRFGTLDHFNCEILPFAAPGYEFWGGMTVHSSGRVVPDDWGLSSTPSSYLLRPGPKAIWNMTFERMKACYPWEEKKNSAIWRGSTTGPRGFPWRKLPRSHLVALSKDHSDIFDAGFTSFADRGLGSDEREEIEREMRLESRIVDSITREDFMLHKAIVDIDGNSWSSRFGMLMCANSVVIKVEPESIDYWYNELKPQVHYLPVHANMSNLIEQIRYAIDPANDAEMRAMVISANEWCRHKMTVTQFSVDMLWILGSYLDVLQMAYTRDGNAGNISDWLSQWRNLTDENKFEIAYPNPTLAK